MRDESFHHVYKARVEREDLLPFRIEYEKKHFFFYLSLYSCLPKVPKRVVVIPIPRAEAR